MYLFDDVLAAVDAHVADHLLRHALTGALLAGKTRILVSHSPAAAAAADVLVLSAPDCPLCMPCMSQSALTSGLCGSMGNSQFDLCMLEATVARSARCKQTPLHRLRPDAHRCKVPQRVLATGEAADGHGRVRGTP